MMNTLALKRGIGADSIQRIQCMPEDDFHGYDLDTIADAQTADLGLGPSMSNSNYSRAKINVAGLVVNIHSGGDPRFSTTPS